VSETVPLNAASAAANFPRKGSSVDFSFTANLIHSSSYNWPPGILDQLTLAVFKKTVRGKTRRAQLIPYILCCRRQHKKLT
jgi:hypothetical protein